VGGFWEGCDSEGAEREHITGVEVPEPPAESRGKNQGSGDDRSPLNLKHFWLLDVQWKPQICAFFKNLKRKKSDTNCVVFANKTLAL